MKDMGPPHYLYNFLSFFQNEKRQDSERGRGEKKQKEDSAEDIIQEIKQTDKAMKNERKNLH